MEAQRYAPAEAYPTRRSLREAQKRGPKDQRSSRSRIDTQKHQLSPIPWAPTQSRQEPSDDGIMANSAPVSRAGRTRTKRASFVPRVAILGSLAAATTIIPLNGPPTSPANAEEGIEYGVTDALDVLMDFDPEARGELDGDPLAADPLVEVRAAVSASRSEGRQAPSCSTLAGSANGSAAAEVAAIAPEVVMPIAEGAYRLTSRYGFRALWGRHSMHAGLDMAAPSGTPIHSIADGVVEYTGPGKAGRSSMLIIVRHNINGQTVRSWYVHMYSNGVYTTPGQQVKAGQVIGAVGSNGNSTGPHLHFEIHTDDNLTTVDPAAWLANNGAETLNQEIRDCLQQ